MNVHSECLVTIPNKSGLVFTDWFNHDTISHHFGDIEGSERKRTSKEDRGVCQKHACTHEYEIEISKKAEYEKVDLDKFFARIQRQSF